MALISAVYIIVGSTRTPLFFSPEELQDCTVPIADRSIIAHLQLDNSEPQKGNVSIIQ